VIVCRKCNRRHPDGTEFCPCGAYLEFDGERVPDAEPARPAPATTPTGPDTTWSPPVEHATPPTTGDPAVAATSEPPRWSGFDTPTTPPTSQSTSDIDAVLPDAPAPTATAPVYVPDTPRPGDLTCPACRTPNSPDRHFCRHCGAALAGVTPTPATDVSTARVPWWRRWGRAARRRSRGTDASSLSRAAADLGRGGLSRRTVLFRTGSVLVLLGGLLAFLGPWRSTVIDRGRDLVGAARYRPIALDEAAVTSEPADPANPPAVFEMQEASNLVDRFANTAWATRWTHALGPGFADAPTDGGCQPEPMTDSSVRIDLGEPTDLERIRILPGRPDADPSRTLFARPRVIELRADDVEDCDYLVLEDSGELATFRFDHDDVSTVTLRIVGIYEAESPNDIVEISEIVLDR
jgi:hypothetical protein